MLTSINPVEIKHDLRELKTPITMGLPNYCSNNEMDRSKEFLMSNLKVTQIQRSINQGEENEPASSSSLSVTNFGKNNHNPNGFDIREFEDVLEPSLKPGKYICPVCECTNLSIDSASGAYNCWNNDSDAHRKEIRDKLSPPMKPNSKQSQSQLQSVGQIATIDEPALVDSHTNNDGSVDTLYPYAEDESLYVNRRDYRRPLYDQETGEITDYKKEKSVLPYYKDSEGKTHCGSKGVDFPPYRLDEALTNGIGQYILVVEGEKAVETLRMKGVVSITFQGSKWDSNSMTNHLARLKNDGKIRGVIVFPDHDKAGKDKSLKVIKAAKQANLHSLLVDPAKVWANMPNGGDAADWLDAVQPDRRVALEALLNASYETDGEANTKVKNKTKASSSPKMSLTENSVDGDTFILDKTKGESLELAMEECLQENWFTRDGCFYQWTGQGNWKRVGSGQIKKHMASLVKNGVVKRKDEGEIVFDSSRTEISQRKLSDAYNYCLYTLEIQDTANEHLRCFRNGTVDMRTGELQQSRKDNYLTEMLPLDYVENADLPERTRHFFEDSFKVSLEQMRALISMYLDPTAPYKFMAHLMGQSGGGKGTLIELLSTAFGDSALSTSKPSILNSPEDRHAHLTNKSFVAFPDTKGFQSDLEALFELIDNHPLDGRARHQPEGYNKHWNCRFIIASVSPLNIENAGEGWERRALIVPVRSRKVKKDPSLLSDLKAELSQTISWALSMDKEGRQEVLENWNEYGEIGEAANETELTGDSVKTFLDQCFRVDRGQLFANGVDKDGNEVGQVFRDDEEFEPQRRAIRSEGHYIEDYKISLERLHKLYLIWCKSTGHKPFTSTKFKNHLATTPAWNWVEQAKPKSVNNTKFRCKTGIRYLIPHPGLFLDADEITPDRLDSGTWGEIKKLA